VEKAKKPKKQGVRAVRWSENSAAIEFGLHQVTLQKNLAAASITPGEDGCYSTQQIVQAIYGDTEHAKARKLSAEADLAELKRDRLRRALVPLHDVKRVWESHTIAQRAAVMAQDCDRRTKDKIIAAIRDIPDDAYFPDDESDDSDDQRSS